MTNTIDMAHNYAKTHPTRDGRSWAGWCESFVWRAGGFDRSFHNAMAAGDASGWLNPDAGSAPRGAIHYWAGVGGDGHVAFELGGGLLLMASEGVTTSYGTAIGTISFRDYARKGIPYRGWSMRHGTQTLASSSATAGNGSTPLENDLDAFQANQLTNIYNAIFKGGPSMPDGTKSLGQSLAEINKTVSRTVSRSVDGVERQVSQIQELADTKTLAQQIREEIQNISIPASGVSVSVADIKTALGDPEILAAFARAVNDDAAERLRS